MKTCPQITEKIEKLIPKKGEVGISNSFDCEMPSVEIDGCDFIGLIKVPSYGKSSRYIQNLSIIFQKYIAEIIMVHLL